MTGGRMTDSLDAATRAGTAALVRRLGNRGEEDGQFATDNELFAQEFFAFLKATGWRPVLAVPADADWRRASGRTPRGSLDPDVKAALFAQFAEASQATRSGTRATGGQPVLAEENNQQEAS
jgi:hypothetical protein